MKNIDIREAIKNANINYWQVAEKIGITDGNFSRKLRNELSEQEKKPIFEAIEKLAKENASC